MKWVQTLGQNTTDKRLEWFGPHYKWEVISGNQILLYTGGKDNWICSCIRLQELKEMSWEVYHYYCSKSWKNGFSLTKIKRDTRGKGLGQNTMVCSWTY